MTSTSTNTEPTDPTLDSAPEPASSTGFPVNRRGVLLGAGATCAVAVLAACGGSSSDASSTPSSAAPTTDTPTSDAPSSAAPSSASSGTEVATLSAITVGSAVSATLDGKPIIVARPTSTTAACFTAICTHEGCTVAPAGATLNCPCHGSKFNATTGQVLNGPATSSLPAISVSVSGGKVIATT
jgi:cytochrome b6-f complex iron-sulfur subunit